MTTALAVLIIEDSESDGQLIVRTLKRAGYDVTAEQVETAEQMRAVLGRRAWDIVISDYSLPQFDGRAALTLLQATGRDIPFIVVSGTIGEETAVAMMKAGAHDYLLKGELARLAPAVERELAQAESRRERHQAEEALQNNEKRFRALIENSLDNISLLAADGTLLWESPAVIRNLGYAPNEFVGRNTFELMHPDDLDRARNILAELVRDPASRQHASFRLRRVDGAWRWVEAIVTNLLNEPSVNAIVINYRDVTERLQAEKELERRAEQFGLLYDAGLALNSVLDPRAQLETIFNIALKALRAARAEFFRYDAARTELRLELVHGYAAEMTPRAMQKLGFILGQDQSLVDWVSQHRQRVYLPDVYADPRWTAIDPEIRSGLWVAVEHEGRLLGVLGVLGILADAFSLEDQRLLELFASQLAVALENARLFEETRLRLAELEAINKVSTALRTAQTLDEMLPVLLDVTLGVMRATQGAIWLYDPGKDELRPAVVRGRGEEPGAPPQASAKPGEGITGYVFATGRAYVAGEFRLAPYLSDSARQGLLPGVGGAAVPIRAGDNVIGTFTINVSLPRELMPSEVHLLTTLSEIAGNAIQRSRLHQQTVRRLQHLTALSDIDRAIGSSFDLQVSLTALLTQAIAQLGVDAADVLVYSPDSLTLEYAAGRGFRTETFERARLRLGEGYAGRAALERRLVYVPDLATQRDNPRLAKALAGEDFVSYHGVPLIAKGQVKGVLEVFRRIPLEPDEEWLDFLNTLAGQAAIAIDNVTLFESLERSNTELTLAYNATIEGWSRALDLRDKETEGHTQRVSDMAVRLALAFGMAEDELAQFHRGALLHDIGKMGVPDGILLKPGPLTDEEWAVMKKHPTFAHQMLSPIQFLHSALDIPYCHHEKWDGTGYPRGLAGERIPLAARIFAVVDVFDALTSDRPYRAAWPEDKVREHIRSLAGTHFDPQVVRVALDSGVLINPVRS